MFEQRPGLGETRDAARSLNRRGETRQAVTYGADGWVGVVVCLVIFAGSAAAGVDILRTTPPPAVGISVIGSSLVWLGLAWLFSSFTRIEVDEQRRALNVFIVRWPWAFQRHSFPIATVRDAIVHKRARSKGVPVYSLELVLEGQDSRVRILERRGFESEPVDRIAARIRQMLGQGADATPP